MTIEEIRTETERIVYTRDYKPGLIFQELNKYWVGILKIDNGIITVLEGENILNLDYFKYSREELTERLKYETFYGCWVNYHETNLDVVKLWMLNKIKSTYNRDKLKYSKLYNLLTT